MRQIHVGGVAMAAQTTKSRVERVLTLQKPGTGMLSVAAWAVVVMLATPVLYLSAAIHSLPQGETLRAQTEYRIGAVEVRGTTVLNEAQIKDVLGLFPGAVYNETRLRKGFEDLKRIYNDRGYANFTPLPVLNFDDQRKIVNLIINIEENG